MKDWCWSGHVFPATFSFFSRSAHRHLPFSLAGRFISISFDCFVSGRHKENWVWFVDRNSRLPSWISSWENVDVFIHLPPQNSGPFSLFVFPFSRNNSFNSPFSFVVCFSLCVCLYLCFFLAGSLDLLVGHRHDVSSYFLLFQQMRISEQLHKSRVVTANY